MIILSVDTATEACSVGLLIENEHHNTIVDGSFEICPQQHSQKILPMIDDLLAKHELGLSDVDVIAYGRGPGSFTGVRIATGIVQGLAFGANIPVVEVSTLAAMAQQSYDNTGVEHTRVLIDARMQEVYFGDYEIVQGIARSIQEESVLAPEQALAKFEQISNDKDYWECAGTGWQAYPSELKFDSAVEVLYPDARAMLKIARHAYISGDTTNVMDIKPTYLRDKVTWKKLPHKE